MLGDKPPVSPSTPRIMPDFFAAPQALLEAGCVHDMGQATIRRSTGRFRLAVPVERFEPAYNRTRTDRLIAEAVFSV